MTDWLLLVGLYPDLGIKIFYSVCSEKFHQRLYMESSVELFEEEIPEHSGLGGTVELFQHKIIHFRLLNL